MKFKCTEDKIIDSIAGVQTVMMKDDTKTVPDGWGDYAVGKGWGVDLDGVVPTGERNPGHVSVSPADLVSKNSAV